MNRLRTLREEKGLTQKQLGKLLTVQHSAVSKYEVGRSSLTDDLIQQLCLIFDVSADYLLGLSDDRGKADHESQPLSEKRAKLLDVADNLTDEEKEKLIDYAELLKRGRTQ